MSTLTITVPAGYPLTAEQAARAANKLCTRRVKVGQVVGAVVNLSSKLPKKKFYEVVDELEVVKNGRTLSIGGHYRP